MTEYILHKGNHNTFEDGHCLMEVVAHLAGEEHSDAPQCACPFLSAFGRKLNDKFPDDESRTKHLGAAAPLLVNSKDVSKERGRAFLLADLAVRRWLPQNLEKLGKKDEAQKMRALDRIVDEIIAREAAIVASATEANAVRVYAAYYAAYYAVCTSDAAYYAAYAADCEDAAACFMAILRGEDPRELSPIG